MFPWKKCLAECIGTAVLTLVACGVAAFTGGDLVPTSLAFGLVIVAMAYSIGNVSGCHINPAVTVAMLIRKKISLKDGCFYILSQFVGAFIGTGLLALFLGNNWMIMGLGQNFIQDNLKVANEFGVLQVTGASYVNAFLVELVLTFIFVLAILGVTDSKFHDGKHAGIVIGLSLALVHLIGIGFTGTSVNPARSLAPSVFYAFSGAEGAGTSLAQSWIWLLAPLCGGALAALLYGLLTKSKEAK